MLMNLKLRAAAPATMMQRLRERVAQRGRRHAYLQPTQDLTIDAETGPTQYRFSLEARTPPP